MALTVLHRTNVCRDGQGNNKCMFLREGEKYNQFFCVKLTGERRTIEETNRKRREAYLQQGIAEKDILIPTGDHCPGYLLLQTVLQGYDVNE